MKYRNGFVSNSSSSSFMILLRKEDYLEVYNNLSDLERDIVNFLEPETINKFGIEFIKLSGMTGNYSSLEDYGCDLDLTDKETEKLENDGPECIYDNIHNQFKEYEHIEDSVDI